jgi:DNA-binding NarL/FixJ family response regulator
MNPELLENGAASVAGLPDGADIVLSLAQRIAVSLNCRERQILTGLRDGATDREIAERLGVSDRTVSFYVRTLSAKLDAKNRTHTVVKALKLGLIKLE